MSAGLGIGEILILLIFGCFWLMVIAAVVGVVFAQRRKQPATATAAQAPRHSPPQPPIDMAADSSILVARITQRFCPQCRSPLAADAPEGLCPACLMAGGLGSDVGAEPINGMAATTPPSGSKPPLVGEIGDLQQHFPQLEILELLGRGGMGAVYKARQKNLDRIVALKVIPPEAAKDPTFAERFGREARALARLNHPNIVTVYDFGQAGELHFLLMEYVDGVNLRQTLRAGRLAPREAVAIVPPICDALQYAHDQGVVHRDIKPENVLLDRSGRVKIADFGLAKLLGKGPDDFTLTRTQQVMGTPRYMAPEQIEKPSTVDHRADIYSLGVVIYEMLTGELPIGRFEPPSHKVQLDVRIDEVVLRSLEKDPQRRYQRASEVKTELASAASWPTLAAASVLASALAGEGPRPGARGQFAQPSWHTPAPAAKFGEPVLHSPAGVPLGMVLAVALGMVLGALMITAGLAAGVYAMTWGFQGFDGAFWGWMGAAFGCIVGGFGSAAGSYNTYRQMAGAEDLMQTPRTTWFDWVMRAYLIIGFVMFLLGASLDGTNGQALMTLGGIAAVQAVLFLVLRSLMARREAQPALDPRQRAISRRVAGPAIGLMIAGFIGLLPSVLALLAVPVFTVVPVKSEFQQETFEVGPVPSPGMLMPLRCLLFGPVPAIGGEVHPILIAQGNAAPAATPMWGMMMLGLLTLLNVPLSLTMIIGGWQMRRLRSHGLAMVASIIAMLPCTLGWFLSLPMGIWALATLLNDEVRDAFDREQHDPGPAAVSPPKPAAIMPTSPHATGSRWTSPAVIAIAGILIVVGGGMLVALLLPAVQSARGAARRAHSTNNLKQIGIALHNYHDVHRTFPPAVVTDASGKPLYSGRVLLLPFLDQQPLYDAFDLTQHWDSPRNLPLSKQELQVFMDPAHTSERTRSDYLFVTGTGTILEAGKAVKLEDVTNGDGAANTVMMVEVKGGGTSWAEPRELDISRPVSLPAGNHVGGHLLLFADGSVRFVEEDLLGPTQVRTLATYAGFEPIEVAPKDFEELLRSLSTETFDAGRLSFIKSMSRTNRFTCEQARQLLSKFDFDSDRQEAAVVLHPRVTDPHNFYMALKAFDQDPARNTVIQRLALDQPAKSLKEEPGIPVSKEEFKALLTALKVPPHDQGKLPFLKMIIHARVFTCDQAAEILKQFAFDDDRERAAVAVYPRLSDPENFYRTLEVFTFDTGRQSVRKQLKLE